MKIAILTSGTLPVPAVKGGAVENLTDFYLEYNEERKLHDMTVYSVYDPKVSESPLLGGEKTHFHYVRDRALGYRVRRYLFRYSCRSAGHNHYTAFFLQEIAAHVRRQKYDCIIVENRPAFILPLSKVTDARLVLHLHNDFLNSSTPRCQEILDACDSVITVSDYIKRRVLTVNSMCPYVTTVYNGIDLDRFRKPDRDSMRRALHFDKDDFVLLFSGRLVPEKGIKELVEAMTLIGDGRIKLLVLGGKSYGNDDTEDNFIGELKRLAEAVPGRIVFTGFVGYEQVPRYLSAADVCVAPSVWDEPLGISVIEGMAASLPVIATRSGGIPEEVTPQCSILLDRSPAVQAVARGGRAAKPNLPQQIADAAVYLFGHPEKRQAMAGVSARRAKLFGKCAYAENFLNALQQ